MEHGVWRVFWQMGRPGEAVEATSQPPSLGCVDPIQAIATCSGLLLLKEHLLQGKGMFIPLHHGNSSLLPTWAEYGPGLFLCSCDQTESGTCSG